MSSNKLKSTRITIVLLDKFPTISKHTFNISESEERFSYVTWIKGIIDSFCLSNDFRHENEAWIYGFSDELLLKIKGNSVRYINPESRSLAMLLRQVFIAHNSNYIKSKMPLGFEIENLSLPSAEKLFLNGLYYDNSGISVQKAIKSYLNTETNNMHIVFDQRKNKNKDSFEALISYKIKNVDERNLSNLIVLTNYYIDKYQQ
jgi:hypothetical protein